jgi:hypothetical protein
LTCLGFVLHQGKYWDIHDFGLETTFYLSQNISRRVDGRGREKSFLIIKMQTREKKKIQEYLNKTVARSRGSWANKALDSI